MKDKVTSMTEEQAYQKSLDTVKDFYLFILIVCGALVVGAIIFAVVYNVFIGLLIAIAAVLLYISLTSNLLYRLLGISYKSSSGQLTVTDFYGKNRHEVWIPRRLIMLDVTEIDNKAFCHKSSSLIEKLHLPSTIKVIGDNAFEGCTALTTLYFEGSEEEWLSIDNHADLVGIKVLFFDGKDGALCSNLPLEQEQITEDEK